LAYNEIDILPSAYQRIPVAAESRLWKSYRLGHQHCLPVILPLSHRDPP
jgi:hypothetical protein